MHEAALAWNDMRDYIARKEGVYIRPVGPMSSYRTFSQQEYLYRLYKAGKGNLAAYPGTSNHGWGLAVDVQTQQMAQLINKHGARFGWQKRWSDAQSEWWHFKYREGWYNAYPIIRRGTDLVEPTKRLQHLLRAAGYKSVKETGFYGIFTRSAVRRFQRKHKLRVDGIVGRSTWRALRKVTS